MFLCIISPQNPPKIMILQKSSKNYKKLCFKQQIKSMCKKPGQKLHALSRISNFLDINQLKRIMKTFILSQFNYCPLVWMFCDRTLNNKINRIHERALRIAYKDMTSDYDTLLLRDNAVPIHIRNLQLQIEQEIDGPNVHHDGKLLLVEGCEVSPEETSIIEKMESILKKEKVRLPPLRGIDKDKVKKAVQKVNAVLAKVMPKDISATNDLLYAGAAVVTEMVGMRKTVSCNRKEPWWKRRLEKQVRELNIDLGRVNRVIQNGKIKRKYKNDLERRCKIRQKGLKTVKEEIKQRISAKIGKIKRCRSRINQYQQNRVFQNNQKRFFEST